MNTKYHEHRFLNNKGVSKTIILSLCLLLGTTFAFGQEKTKQKKTPEQRAEMLTKRLADEVTLTPQQWDKIYDINLRSVQKTVAIRKDTLMTDEQRKEKIKKNQAASKKLVMAELTPEQKEILKAKRKANKEKELEEEE